MKEPYSWNKQSRKLYIKEQYVYLKFLPVYFKEDSCAVTNALREEMCQQPSFARFIKMNHVATWKGTDYPLILPGYPGICFPVYRIYGTSGYQALPFA
jgi:hypothetical protein